MPTLGSQLQKVSRLLQREVAPGIGDSIIEVWRQSDVSTPGGAGYDAAGNEISAGSDAIGLAAMYYARFTHNAEGNESPAGGQPVSVLPYIFIFNAGDKPDIRGDDMLLEAAKRETDLAIADIGWWPLTEYATGTIEQPTAESQLYAEATSGGVSGADEPEWPAVAGETVEDGTVTWTMRDKRSFSVIDPGGRETINVEYVVVAQDSREGGR